MRLDYASYVLVIVVGLSIVFGVFLKLVVGYNLDSDWFWLLAGMGLMVEAVISFKKQKRFDRKYMIVER